MPDEITIEGLHQVFTTKKLMKQAQSDNPLALRGFKKPVTFSLDREEIRLTQTGDDNGGESDLYNTQVSKVVLAKDIESNVYIIVRRNKQEGKFACHCLSSKAKDQESERMAKYIMHWVRALAAGGRTSRVRATTSTGDVERPTSLLTPGSRMTSDPHDNRAATEQRVRAPEGGLAGVGVGRTTAPRLPPVDDGKKPNQSLIRSMIWYHGTIDRHSAESRLNGKPIGTFLVRYSEKKEEYCLSIVTVHSAVQHFVTVSAPNGKVSLHGHKNQYDSMMELIDHYSRYDISSEGDKCIEPLSQSR